MLKIFISDAPTVEILMIPEGPVKESDESNVTLFATCWMQIRLFLPK